MKILQINCVYKEGSTGKIVYDIHKSLKNLQHESVVCYGRGKSNKEKYVYKSCGELYSKFNNLLSRFNGIMYGGCLFSTNKLIRIIKKEKPDIVHVQCINGYFVNIYRLISYLNYNKCNTVLTLHAEFMYTANCGHALECERWKSGCGNCPRLKKETKSILIDNTSLSWNKMKKAFEGFENITIVSVSPWLMQRAMCSPILRGKKHITVLNGIDSTIFHVYVNSSMKHILKIENKKVIFHATAFFSAEKDHLKGGYYVIEMAKRFWKENNNVVFLVAGKYEKIKNIPPNIILLGEIKDQEELAEYYSVSDVTLLTSKKETFSMVVAESLCCGTPVVGFEAGAPEKITLSEFSDFVPYGEINKLYNELNKYLNYSNFNKQVISRIAKEKYSKDTMVEQYMKIYKEML